MEDGILYYNAAYALHITMPDEAKSKPVPVVIILPGGAYYKLSTKYEGSEVAAWLNQRGIGAAVLHYRMPNHHSEWPQEDIDRAIQELHDQAPQMGIDTTKIGLMGFSAGGHAVAVALTRSLPLACGILFYPVVSMDKALTHQETHDWLLDVDATVDQERAHSAHGLVHANMPPTLIIACEDDDLVPVDNSKLYYQALLSNGVKAEMHIVAHGGHGWGFSADTPEPYNVYGWLQTWVDTNLLHG